MLPRRCLLAVVVCATVALATPAADPPALADGKYLLTMSTAPVAEERIAIVKLAGKDGQYTAEVIATPPPPKPQPGRPPIQAPKVTVGEPKVSGGLVTFPVEIGRAKYAFEGRLDEKAPKTVIGSVGIGKAAYRAAFAATDLDEIKEVSGMVPVKVPDDLAQLNKLRSASFPFQMQARQEKDADKRKELLDKAKAARKEADEQVPGLLVKVVDGNPDTAAGYHATLDLLGVVGKTKATAADLTKWTAAAMAFAAKHGPRFEKYTSVRIAEGLSAQPAFGAVALPFAERYVADNQKGELVDQQRAYRALAAALEGAGKTAEAKAARGKVEAIDVALDAEYKKITPGFPVEKYAGRKNPEANRVAVLELFTGAQCPPCVAADIAFDALEQAYSPKDVVLVQYHMHIPGPDPMTNKDTEARWAYYTEKFPQQIGGVPSSLFNGKPQSGGGGPREMARGKFDAYRKLIDPLLEQKSDLKVDGSAVLADGGVTVSASVGGMDKPAESVKVRVLLAEEEVKYAGGNGIRFHHMVVRSAFGKADGWAAKDLKAGKVTATVRLDDLKKDLGAYLEEYNKTERAFSPPDRPLAMKHLKVIVLVQDDETGEILQAAQMDVTGGKS
jgi:hypothetical protein